MSPKIALRILLFSSFFLVVSLLALYKLRVNHNASYLRDVEYQTRVEKAFLEVSSLLEEGGEEFSTIKEASEYLIIKDLNEHGKVRPETNQKIIDMANRENRIRNGLSVD